MSDIWVAVLPTGFRLIIVFEGDLFPASNQKKVKHSSYEVAELNTVN